MNSDEQAIRQMITTWLSATKAGDSAKVLTLMSDDVVFLRPGCPPMRGKDEFAASLKSIGEMDFDSASDVQEVKVFGDWAYVWSHLSIVVKPKKGNAAAVKRSGDILSVLNRQNGRWVFVRDANMLTAMT
jgi:uncharacterized protein (TIGR02246 family)